MGNKLVAVDVETYDPGLKEFGDGSCRESGTRDDDGSCLLCVGTFDGQTAKAYMPFTSEWNEFVKMMEDPSIDKVMHNGIYDLAWLHCGYDVNPKGLLHDTMTRMVYINEYSDLDLDSCCKRFKIQGKNKDDTIEKWYNEHKETVQASFDIMGEPYKKNDSLWAHSKFLWQTSKEFRDNMIKYNLQDCRATYYLYYAQEPYMTKVMNAYMVDVKITPLILQMKKTGVLIDQDKLKELTAMVEEDYNKVSNRLINEYGVYPEMIASGKKLAVRLNEMGIHSPSLTKTGAESWNKNARARISHPVMPLIEEFKNYDAVLNKYLHGDMAKSIMTDGRIHCTFSPNKREDGGTVTGRFACSHPNLQQVPKKDKPYGTSYGKKMRALFIPEEGCMMSAMDYSQIEYLLLGHYAVGNQAEWFREQANAGVDFHTVAMNVTGIPTRAVVKTFNYGVIYGMGWRTAMQNNYALFEKLAAEKGEDIETFTKETYYGYHERLPVIHDTMSYVQDVAQRQGYVLTIGGRYQHKPKPTYDPATGKIQDWMYKMLNKLIQGSAADILKFALLRAYEAGVFDVLKMHLTIHDENVTSVPYNKEGTEAAKELKHIMDTSFHDKLRVPMKAETEVGPSWGYYQDDIWEDMQNGKFDRQKDTWWGKAA